MIGKRYTVAAILLSLGPLLGSCSGFSGYVSDHWPHWAGGMPGDVPPRPGTPGYEEFIAHGGANQNATQSAAAGTPAPEFVATGSTAAGAKPAPGMKPAASPAKLSAQQAPAAPVGPAEDQPSQDSGVVRGGLY